VVAALVLLGACNGPPAHAVAWTAAQLEAFERFRGSRDGDRLKFARAVVGALPNVMDFATLEVKMPMEQQPGEAEVLEQLGPADNTFTFDRYPTYMGGKVAATVDLGEYHAYIYELGCCQRQQAVREGGSSETEVLCSTLDVVMFRRRVVSAIIVHNKPERVRRLLSVH